MPREPRSLKALLDSDAVSKWINAYMLHDGSDKDKRAAANKVIVRNFPGVSTEVLTAIDRLAMDGMRRAKRFR